MLPRRFAPRALPERACNGRPRLQVFFEPRGILCSLARFPGNKDDFETVVFQGAFRNDF